MAWVHHYLANRCTGRRAPGCSPCLAHGARDPSALTCSSAAMSTALWLTSSFTTALHNTGHLAGRFG